MKAIVHTVIVDDEPLARAALRAMLNDEPDIEIVAECRNRKEAVRAIRREAPELVFLDVQMPDGDGFQVVEEIGVKQMPVTVFVTAYDKYALRAFAAHALDYLLKPFDHERFSHALQRARSQVEEQKRSEMSDKLLALLGEFHAASGSSLNAENEKKIEGVNNKPLERLVIKSGGRIYFLKVEEIHWIEATGDYVRLHAGSKSHLMRETMGSLHGRLNPNRFVRIHRSTVVNIELVKDIQPLFKGEYVVTLIDGTQLKSSRGYRNQLQPLLDEAH